MSRWKKKRKRWNPARQERGGKIEAEREREREGERERERERNYQRDTIIK